MKTKLTMVTARINGRWVTVFTHLPVETRVMSQGLTEKVRAPAGYVNRILRALGGQRGQTYSLS